MVTGSIGVDPSSDPNQVLKSAREISSSNTAIGSFQMVGSTYTASGFTSTSSSSSSEVNLPLILGIAIPVTILFVVVVVVIVIKVGRGKNSIAEKEVVKL